jgi:hypothetical protein
MADRALNAGRVDRRRFSTVKGTREKPERRHADWAEELEADAELYPEERGEILLEAAAQWRFAGNIDRARALWQALIAEGGEDGQYARVDVAELHLESGDVDAANAELAALRAERPLWVAPCHMAAEVLEEHGHLAEALSWFNIATTRLDEGELDRVDDATFSYAGQVLRGRRHVRQALGMPEDDLDALVAAPPSGAGPHPFPTADELLGDLADGVAPPAAVRSLFWPRAEMSAVRDRWPDTFGAGEPGEYYRGLEAGFRAMAARGARRITLVPGTAHGLAAFAAGEAGSPEDSLIRRSYLDDLFGRGIRVAWPPPRNGSCWCGSGAKYKKCCGSPVPVPS